MLLLLRETVGTSPNPRPPVALARVQLPPAQLPEGARAELQRLLGADAVRDDHAQRVGHAAGRGYPDLVRLRAGELPEAPDAVLYPSSPEQIGALMALCAKRSIAVVPSVGAPAWWVGWRRCGASTRRWWRWTWAISTSSSRSTPNRDWQPPGRECACPR